MTVILFERADGGVSVVNPAPEFRDLYVFDERNQLISIMSATRGDPATVPGAKSFRVESDESFLRRVIARSIPEGTPYEIAERETVLPTSRKFRDAWRWKFGVFEKVEVDVVRARELVIEYLKPDLEKKLAEVDDAILGEDRPQEQARLKAKRKTLQNFPIEIAGAIASMDVAQLETYQPTWPE